MPDWFDLAVTWDWEYDRDFVGMLDRALAERGLRCWCVTHHNVRETLSRLQEGAIAFRMLLNRAAETDAEFTPLLRALRRAPLLQINDHAAVERASDKATMHLEFLTKGLEVPYTIIISPYAKRREVGLSLTDLARLGRPFIIKPANTTGGGTGVILGAETLKDVIESRQHHKNDKYLLQEHVVPVTLGGRRAWFRVFLVCGTEMLCWWDDETHVYAEVTPEEEVRHGLGPLRQIIRSIGEVCRLDFFSSEIARTARGAFVVVDYVNEICDMRLQSAHADGVPDAVVGGVCRSIAGHVARGAAPRGGEAGPANGYIIEQNRGSSR